MLAVLFEQRGNTGIATINRPEANQLSHEVFEDFTRILDSCESDPSVRVVIITGAGSKIFCAGADLSQGFGDFTPVEFLKRGQDIFNRIENFPKPVIAAINGHAFGGGCELALACHMRLIKNGARIGLTETNLGIIPGYGGTMRLPRLIGWTKALEYILMGREMEADRAYELGLVNRVCREDKIFDDALELASALGERPPLAVKAILKIMNISYRAGFDEHLLAERSELASLFSTKDAAEGITAFIQKRKPSFRGE